MAHLPPGRRAAQAATWGMAGPGRGRAYGPNGLGRRGRPAGAPRLPSSLPWPAMTRPPGDLGARLLRASQAIDRAFRRFDRLRSELVVALAGDDVLDRYNDLMYSGSGDYDPASPDFLDFLFPWEERTIERFFPPPPARVLVGAAGAGREAFALAERGYEIVAFDPAGGPVRSMAERIAPQGKVAVYRAAYEDLPLLSPPVPGRARATLDAVGPFDVALLGLGSISHVRTDAGRLHALRSIAAVTGGPLVVSFLARPPSGGGREPRLRRLTERARSRRGRDGADRFALEAGFFHPFDEPEISELAERAGLDVIHYDADVRRVYPHAVLIDRSA